MARAVKILGLVLFIAYPFLLHIFILKDGVEPWLLLLVFSPMLIAASWVIFRSAAKILWPLWILSLAGLIYYVVTGEHGRIGLLAVNGLSHAALNLFLLWFFGRTLLAGKEPLISQISRHINGKLTPEIATYTRNVTISWCIFFALQVVISLLLYFFVSTAAWSLFINVLNLPLLIMMFVVEFAYRSVRFPNHSRTTIVTAIKVYAKDFAVSKKTDSEP